MLDSLSIGPGWFELMNASTERAANKFIQKRNSNSN